MFPKSKCAYVSLVGWLVFFGLALVGAARKPAQYGPDFQWLPLPAWAALPPSGWREEDVWVTLVLASLILAAWLMHASDEKWKSSGFGDLHDRSKSLLQMDDG